jgi:hypothetical protein
MAPGKQAVAEEAYHTVDVREIIKIKGSNGAWKSVLQPAYLVAFGENHQPCWSPIVVVFAARTLQKIAFSKPFATFLVAVLVAGGGRLVWPTRTHQPVS